MTDAVVAPLHLLRGSDYQKGWSLRDKATGASLIAADDTLELVIKRAQGTSPAYVTLGHDADPTHTGISGIDADTGAFRVTIRAAALPSVPGAAQEKVSCAWHFAVTTAAGLKTVYAYGPCKVDPEP